MKSLKNCKPSEYPTLVTLACTRAMIKAMGLQAENQVCVADESSILYEGKDFTKILEEEGISFPDEDQLKDFEEERGPFEEMKPGTIVDCNKTPDPEKTISAYEVAKAAEVYGIDLINVILNKDLKNQMRGHMHGDKEM